MSFPINISFPSDQSEAQLQEIIEPKRSEKGAEAAGVYLYTKAGAKTGKTLTLPQSQFDSMKNKDIIKCL